MADRLSSFEHFEHQADMGVRGFGRTCEEAFEQAALALTAVVVPPELIEARENVLVTCAAGDIELLLLDWLSAVVYQTYMEEQGGVAGADPDAVSFEAKHRQRDQLGTLGSGNHYLEVQAVTEIYDADSAAAFGLRVGDVVLSVHCGSRGLGHQIGTDYLKSMLGEAKASGLDLPERELACARLDSELGRDYLGAMRAAINCAMANRQVITHFAREAFVVVFPAAALTLLYDVSHNTCKEELHEVDGSPRRLFVHRKGATRAFGPGHPDVPEPYRSVGQPVLVGGSMGTASYVLVGASDGVAFSSAVHGAGRTLSRHEATRRWKGQSIVNDLASRGIFIRSPSLRGLAEEAPGAYKDINTVVDAAETARLARKVAKLVPLACVKG